MKLSGQSTPPHRAFTLLEMTVVILVLLTLIGTGVFSSRKIGDWRIAREAGETLRTVYTAQRMFLADNPTKAVSSIATTDIIPYLPNSVTVMPTVKSLTGTTLGFCVNNMDTTKPPVYLTISGGTHYDPSGSYTDSLWDIGELKR